MICKALPPRKGLVLSHAGWAREVQALGVDRASALLGLAVAKYPTHDAEVGMLVQMAQAES